MRGLLAGLLIALIIVAVALAVAAIGALGVAAIGLMLHRWFDLTQWQGSLLALTMAFGLGYLVFRLAVQASPVPPWEGEWDDVEEDEEDEETPDEAPPIVPWRRTRPTPGELPGQKSAGQTRRPSGKG